MTLLKTARGQTDSLKLRRFSTPISLDPIIYSGTLVIGTDDKIYMSNGTAWVDTTGSGEILQEVQEMIDAAMGIFGMSIANTIVEIDNRLDELETTVLTIDDLVLQANTLASDISNLELASGELEGRVEALELAANSTLSYAIALNQAFVDSQSRYIEDQDIIDDRLLALENP